MFEGVKSGVDEALFCAGSGTSKTLQKTTFGLMNFYPQKTNTDCGRACVPQKCISQVLADYHSCTKKTHNLAQQAKQSIKQNCPPNPKTFQNHGWCNQKVTVP